MNLTSKSPPIARVFKLVCVAGKGWKPLQHEGESEICRTDRPSWLVGSPLSCPERHSENRRLSCLKHELTTISLNSTSKFAVRVVPSLLGYAAEFGRPPERVALALAALIRFYKGEWEGERIPLNDEPEVLGWWRECWSEKGSIQELVDGVLGDRGVWGEDLTEVAGLVAMVGRYLELIEREGVGGALLDV